MKKEFDFEKIGKRTPYRVPEGFFEEMQDHVLLATGGKKKRRLSFPRTVALTLAAAAVVLGVLLLPNIISKNQDNMLTEDALVINTSWIDNMSDEDLAYMESIYDCDIFMY